MQELQNNVNFNGDINAVILFILNIFLYNIQKFTWELIEFHTSIQRVKKSWLIHYKIYKETFVKITSNKRNFVFLNVSLNLSKLSVSAISKDKDMVFGIVDNSVEVTVYFLRHLCK